MVCSSVMVREGEAATLENYAVGTLFDSPVDVSADALALTRQLTSLRLGGMSSALYAVPPGLGVLGGTTTRDIAHTAAWEEQAVWLELSETIQESLCAFEVNRITEENRRHDRYEVDDEGALQVLLRDHREGVHDLPVLVPVGPQEVHHSINQECDPCEAGASSGLWSLVRAAVAK